MFLSSHGEGRRPISLTTNENVDKRQTTDEPQSQLEMHSYDDENNKMSCKQQNMRKEDESYFTSTDGVGGGVIERERIHRQENTEKVRKEFVSEKLP